MKLRLVKFRIDRDLDAGLKRLRDRDGISAAEAIRRAVRDYLKKKKAAAILLPLLLAAPAVRAAEDPIGRAVALLAEKPAAPVVVAHTARPAFCQSVATAWTDGATIFVNDQSEPYRRASKGDAIGLAAAIAHEAWHVSHGADEASAYAEQLRVLRALGAKRRDVEPVARAAAQIGGLR